MKTYFIYPILISITLLSDISLENINYNYKMYKVQCNLTEA